MISTDAGEKLEKLVRMLSSDKDGEVIAAAHAIKRTLQSSGSDIHEFAERLKGKQRSLSEAEMNKIYKAGYQDGKDAGAVDRGFNNAGPSWHEMATFCAEHHLAGALSERERQFINDMVRWCSRREPSEKQGKWLHSIYYKLGRGRQ
jgi:hypothetical protein